VEDKKVCNKCAKKKVLNDFHKRACAQDGRTSICKECRNAKEIERREKIKNSPKNVPKEKVCSVCAMKKPNSKFSKSSVSITGISSECLECKAKKQRVYIDKNRDRINERTRKDRKLNPEKYAAWDKRKWERNKENAKDVDESLTKECKKCGSEKELSNFDIRVNGHMHRSDMCIECKEPQSKEDRLRWRQNYMSVPENRERANYLRTERRKKNPEKYNRQARDRRNRNKENPDWLAKEAHRTLLKNFIQKTGQKKPARTYEVLGYSYQELSNHLDSLMPEGLGSYIENRGAKMYHIDHIISVACFEPTASPHVVNALPNLRPMWWKDNLSRSQKIDWDSEEVQNVIENVPEAIFYIKEQYL